MRHSHSKKLDQVGAEVGFDKSQALKFIRREWIVLANPAASEFEVELDEEDLARMRLIFQLQNDFGVNDEAVPIILHLLDQIYALRSKR